MVQLVLVGIGAGAATALLFASVASGSLISVALFYLAPLPILIAALGWSHWAGLVAAVTASASLAAVFGSFFFIAFLIGIGLPAWWLGYLALLARPAPGPAEGGLEWYPVGNLVVWAAILAALIVGAAIINFGADQETFRNALRSGLDRMLAGETRTPVNPADRERLVTFLVGALPPAAAVLTTLTQVVNLWLAARIVRVSGRLRRPEPYIPSMQFPPYALALAAAGIAGSFVPGLPGTIAGVLGAAMLMAYALLGFAVVHTVTRGIGGRPFVLGGLYGAVAVFGWPILAVSLLGLADAGFNIRGRYGPPSPPQPPQNPT